jgi:hypothetical protein
VADVGQGQRNHRLNEIGTYRLGLRVFEVFATVPPLTPRLPDRGRGVETPHQTSALVSLITRIDEEERPILPPLRVS